MSATLSRVVPADVLTPIGAYRALATPQASCLLESVESGGRISRYSFIGLDYAAAVEFDADAQLYPRIRAFVGPHRAAAHSDPLGGALVAFAYDAARPAARLPSRPVADPAMPSAYVAIPATWLIFDHFTDLLTIWTCGDDARVLERRIDGYIERLLAAQPSFPGSIRARGDATTVRRRAIVTSNWRPRQSVASSRATSINCNSEFASPRSSKAKRSISIEHCGVTIPRPTCFTSRRRLASCWARRPSFWYGWKDGALVCDRSPAPALAQTTMWRTRASPRNCSPTRKNAPSTSCWWI